MSKYRNSGKKTAHSILVLNFALYSLFYMNKSMYCYCIYFNNK